MKNLVAGTLCSLFAAGMLYGNAAAASDSNVCELYSNCTVDTVRINAKSNIVLVTANGKDSIPASCSENFAIDLSTTGGEAMYRAVLSAKTSGSYVFINITNDTRFNHDQCLISDFRMLSGN